MHPSGAAAKDAAPIQKSGHSTKGASGLLRRLNVSRKTEPLLAGELVRCFEEGALPSQWSRHLDKENRPFFWNESTQTSTWVHPAEAALEELVRAGRAVSKAASPNQEASRWSKAWRKEAEESVGHWRWTSAPDGTPYYYQAETQETSWHDPRQDLSLVFELKYHALEGLVASMKHRSTQQDQDLESKVCDSAKSNTDVSSCPRRGLAAKEWMDPVVYGKQLGLAGNSKALHILTPALLLDLPDNFAAWRDAKGRMYFEKVATATEEAQVTWEHPLHNLFGELASMLLAAEASAEAPNVALRRGLRNLREDVARHEGLGAAGPEGASGRVLRAVWTQAFPDEPFLADDPCQKKTKAENCEALAQKAEEKCLRLQKELEKQQLLYNEANEQAKDAKEKHALASARRKDEIEARCAAEAQLQAAQAELDKQYKRCSDVEESVARLTAFNSEESRVREGLQSEVEGLRNEVQEWQKRVEEAHLACAQANAQIQDSQEACARSTAEKDKEAAACKQLEAQLLRVVSEAEKQRKRAEDAEEAYDLTVASRKQETDEWLEVKACEALKHEALQADLAKATQEAAQQQKRADDAEEQRALTSARRREQDSELEEHRAKLDHLRNELAKVTAVKTEASSKFLESQEKTAAARARMLVSDVVSKWWAQKVEVLEKEYSNHIWLHEEIEKEYKISLQTKDVEVAEQKKLWEAAQAARDAAESEQQKAAEETRQLEEKISDLMHRAEEADKARALASARRHDEEAQRSKAEAEVVQSAEKVRVVEQEARSFEQQLSLMKTALEEEQTAHQLANAQRQEQENRRIEVEAEFELMKTRLEEEETLHQLASARRQEQEKRATEVEAELEPVLQDKKQLIEKNLVDAEQLSVMRKRLEDEEQAHQLSSARRKEQETQCSQVEAELKKAMQELELMRKERQAFVAKASSPSEDANEEDVYEGDWHESDTHHQSESASTPEKSRHFEASEQSPQEPSDGHVKSLEKSIRQGRSRRRPPRILPAQTRLENPKHRHGWESASTREPSPGGGSCTGTEQSRGGSPDSALQAEIKSLMRSREEDHRMILELKEELRRSLASSQIESTSSTPDRAGKIDWEDSITSPGSIAGEILEEALKEEALLIASKSLATFFPSTQKTCKRPASSRRKCDSAPEAPEAPAPQQFPAPPLPTSLPVPARTKRTSNIPLQKGHHEVGSASCRSASSGAGARTSRRSLDGADAVTTCSSSACRSESTVCLRKAAKRSPRAPRAHSSASDRGFFDGAISTSTPTLREAWVPKAAIGGAVPGGGGNPLGGAPRKTPLAADSDYRKALSYEKIAHCLERQQRPSARGRTRPYSAGILNAYPEAAKVLQAVV
eukprot:gnl/MRDRNA2_/MRDRNA2_91012_c0_seq1.p1 gnl/MRDRNA2_/MRDRNA2_91012_c0~~gnl/MRDRNA2_/MRDRNA2_91012_c0_seq1.p1  ORF type:complete len:1406 (-),score=395.97 gnl/MRDRNA2_/MRDRNA2_91012_c0_seq1:317-4384(-)